MPAPAPQKVAPTAKIPDDAPIAPPTRPGPSAQHPNVSYAPPAMPTPAPGALQAPQIPPTSHGRPPQSAGPAPHARAASRAPVDSGSSFVAPAQTPLGLIAIVLLVDLVLAGTGAFLLAKGLSTPANAASKDEPKAETPKAPPAKSSEAAPPVAPAPVPQTPRSPETPTPAPPETAAAEPPPAKAEKPAKTETPASARRPATPAAAKPSTETEIATKVMGSRIAFGQCREQAGEVHGNIQIAFRVLGDGSVSNLSVVEDTTGNPSLAPCLRDTIATWKVTPHNGAPLSFVRPFNYP